MSNMIYVGQTKDTGALGFTQDLARANANFEQPFTAYIHFKDHQAIIDKSESDLKLAVETVEKLLVEFTCGKNNHEIFAVNLCKQTLAKIRGGK